MNFFERASDQTKSNSPRAIAISRMRSLEQEAANGRKLSRINDRLTAAWYLRRAWRQANKAGLKKEKFQDRVLDALQHRHARRETFKLANYLLPRRYETVGSALPDYDKNSDRREPLQGLEPYLKGIEIAAVWCGVDPDDWKLQMLQDTSLWKRSSAEASIQDPDERPAETLALLCSALCADIAHRHDLGRVYAALGRLSCRWEMFDDRLVSGGANFNEFLVSPINPAFGSVSYFEESVPYPSVPLLQVPYLVAPALVSIAPQSLLHELDRDHANSKEYGRGGVGIEAAFHPGRKLYTFPDNAPGQRQLVVQLVYQREIRLCIVPDGHGEFTAALETRPRVELVFPDDDPLAGRNFVKAAWKPTFGEALFYARRSDDGPVFPTIHGPDGTIWRVRLDETDLDAWQVVTRDPELGWEFDVDPVGAPGVQDLEPWYLSYTPATPSHLAHWLMNDWPLAHEFSKCPWDRKTGSHGAQPARYDRNLPPLHELKFTEGNAASHVECCLHNGLIEEALDASARRLAEQVANCQRDWVAASDGHVQVLLNRWSARKET